MLPSNQIQRLLETVSRLAPPRRGPVKQIMVERWVRHGDTNGWTSVTLDRQANASIQSELERLATASGLNPRKSLAAGTDDARFEPHHPPQS